MITPNQHYLLPNKNHDVVEDVNDLRNTFAMIDADVKNTEQNIEDLFVTISDLENRAVHCSNAIENSEIQNISANRYLVVNQNGDGFECLDGGGDAGGSLGQCSIKKSDANFDTAWGDLLKISKNGMTVQENSETSQRNETHIFCDETEIENETQLPKVELTNAQSKSDFYAENNESVIFRDEIESFSETTQVATNQNFGLVTIGNGFSNDNGTISAQIISKATKENIGTIKIGDGLNVANGIISKQEIAPATFSEFGVVKLGSNLGINSSGEMEISDMANAATIYNLGHVKICNNGIIDLEEQTLIYRTFVNEDLVLHFEYDFEATADFSFVLEIISNGLHLISFNENLNPKISPLPINRGTTKIFITKKIGIPHYDVTISRLDAPEATLLTPNYGDDINSNLCVTHNGSDWNAHDQLQSSTTSVNFFGREFYFEFATLVVVDYVYFTSQYSDQTFSEFWLKASNDKENWTTLIYKSDETVNGNIYTNFKGCFRYYKLYIGWQNSNYPRSMQLWGTVIDNNESELIKVTPLMSSATNSLATLTCSNLHSGNIQGVTENNGSAIYVKYSSTDTDDLTRWIKYELTEPAVANLLDVCGVDGDHDYTMHWYKLEGSNDDENWTLLLERQYQRDFYKYETRWHQFENATAYKYYKLTCLETGSSAEYWRIRRFRLFRRETGKWNFHRGVPILSAATQDGYEILASSEYNSGHAAKYAFDGNTTTKWAVSGNGVGAWLQIKLPSKTIFNAFQIASRGDGNYNTQAPKDFELQGSNDGENWTTLSTQTDISWSQGEYKTFRCANETAYLYYRLYVNANNGGSDTGIGEFVIGNSVHEYKRWLDKYDNVVPTMTSDETTGTDGIYKLSSSSEHSSHKRIYLFDKRFDTRFELNGEISGWIQVELPIAKFVNVLCIGARSDGWCVAGPRDYTLLGSNDGTNWTQLFSISNSNTFSASELRTHELSHSTAYKFYRLNISNPDSSVLTFARWDLIFKEVIQEY